MKADFDGFTREFCCQPLNVGIPRVTRRTSRHDGKVTEYTYNIRYTPDLLRLTDYGPIVEEWKTEQELLKLAKKEPERFFKVEGTWHCPEREEYFKTLGITFCLRSSAEHDDLFASNLEHLAAFLNDDQRPVTDDAWSAIEKVVIKRGGAISFSALIREAYDDNTPWNEDIVLPTPVGRFRVDDIWKSIADQRLFVDLEYDDLSDPHMVVLCLTREQLEAAKWRRPPPHAVSTHFVMTVDIGTEFIFRGKADVYTVTAMPEGKVFFRDFTSKVFEHLSDQDFQTLMYSGDIQLLSTSQGTDELLDGSPRITDEQVRKAHYRFKLLTILEHTDVSHVEDVRTIQRWQKKKRDAGDSKPLQMLALVPGRPGGRGPQIVDDVLDLIKEVACGANNPTNPKESHSFGVFVKLCEERKLKPCSKNTFYLRSAQFRDIRKREGSRRAYNQEPAIWYLHRHDKIHGGRPFHRVHIDHTKLDIFIKVRGFGGRIYKLRPWLTVLIDEETRAVLGFYLAAHPPSTVSCMMAIRAMVALHKRVPDFIVCDNGKEFLSKAFDRFCDLNDITIDYRPAHESRFGLVIERLFGSTNTELIHNLVGNTKAMQHVRTLTRSVDPINAKHLSFVHLHGLLEHYFFVQYNREDSHPAHDHTPEQYMHKRFMETGRRLSRLRPYDTQFMLQTLIPVSNGGTRSINPTMGIKIGPIWYWTDEFAAKRHKKTKVESFVDMWDVSVAYVVIKGLWHKCISSLLLRYRNLTAIELRYALYEVRLRLKSAPAECFESVLEGVLAEHNLPTAAEATAATRQIYGPAGLTAVLSRDEHDSQMQDAAAEAPASSGSSANGTAASQVHSNNKKKSPRFNVDYASLPIRKSI
ncbi:DDE-type integrase/transposase/recombinase [Paraburkholderia sabiae]|uniref:DDE-type integrase/transposase/recombinase n=1 Tax=Paraburkholderia sabiae TaxID=273251 RepID=A0ABU9QN29_9BURK|nr:DDE-type integrase/transposase/recombinase [Paraburkholderia sabiae]WJZ72162.1 DDE-type integrase/transposase/recombinase [Paraburkholderia sabiae]